MILNPLLPRWVHVLRVRNYKSIPLRDHHELPYRTTAVYYCVRGYKILYVGKSANLYHRWNSYRYGEHHKTEELLEIERTEGDIDLHYCEWNEALIGFIEAVEIKRFKPPMNKRKERVWENINLTVISFCLKYYGTEALMFALAISVLGLLTYHFVF